jgi:hypothetical protein
VQTCGACGTVATDGTSTRCRACGTPYETRPGDWAPWGEPIERHAPVPEPAVAAAAPIPPSASASHGAPLLPPLPARPSARAAAAVGLSSPAVDDAVDTVVGVAGAVGVVVGLFCQWLSVFSAFSIPLLFLVTPSTTVEYPRLGLPLLALALAGVFCSVTVGRERGRVLAAVLVLGMTGLFCAQVAGELHGTSVSFGDVIGSGPLVTACSALVLMLSPSLRHRGTTRRVMALVIAALLAAGTWAFFARHDNTLFGPRLTSTATGPAPTAPAVPAPAT